MSTTIPTKARLSKFSSNKAGGHRRKDCPKLASNSFHSRYIDQCRVSAFNIFLTLIAGDNQTVRPENTISSVRDQPPSGTDGSNEQNNTMSIGAAIETSDAIGNDQDVDFQLDSIFLSDDGFLNTTLDWFTWPNEELSDLSEQVS